MTGNMGTVEYMAPECLKNEPYTEKCDGEIRCCKIVLMCLVYSYGVVLCELFTREELYKDMSVVQIRFMVRTQCLRPDVPNFIPIAMKNLIQLCWDSDPGTSDLRPTLRFCRYSTTFFWNIGNSCGISTWPKDSVGTTQTLGVELNPQVLISLLWFNSPEKLTRDLRAFEVPANWVRVLARASCGSLNPFDANTVWTVCLGRITVQWIVIYCAVIF